MPSSWAEARALGATTPTDEAYRERVRALLLRLGLFEDVVVDDILRPSRLPTPKVGQGALALSFVTKQSFGYYSTLVGPWQIEKLGSSLGFRIESRKPHIGVLWRVQLAFDDGIAVVRAPDAEVRDDHHAVWTFQQGAPRPSAEATGDPTPQVKTRLGASTWWVYGRTASHLLIPALLPLLVLLLAPRWVSADSAEEPVAPAAAWARRLALAAMAIAIAQLAGFTLGFGVIRTWIEHQASPSDWYYSATAIDLSEIGMATIAIAFVLPHLSSSATTPVRFFSAALALAVLVASVPPNMAYWPSDRVPHFIPHSHEALAALSIAVVLIFGTFAVRLSLRATGQLVDATFGADLRSGAVSLASHLGRPALWIASLSRLSRFLLLTVSILLSSAWLLVQYGQYRDATHQFGRLSLSDFLRYFPFDLAGALGSLLRLLLLLALVGLLQASGSLASGPMFGEQRHRVLAVLALAFAGWVVGMGGSVSGFAFPLPGLVALLTVVLFAGGRQLDDREQTIAHENPGSEFSTAVFGNSEFRREMLARARAIAATRRKQGSLYRSYRAGDLPERKYDAAFREAEHEVAFLRSGGPRVAAPEPPPSLGVLGWIKSLRASTPPPAAPTRAYLVLPPKTSPYSFALSLGPRTTWWQNGKLASLMAVPLGLIPLFYFGAHYQMPSGGFAPFFVAVDFASEWLRWIVAGLVFGCCFGYLPGRVGLIKAGALLLGVAVTVGVLSLASAWVALPSRMTADIALLVLFLLVVGFLMDWWTLKERNIDARHLADLYELHVLKKVALLLPPALGVLLIAHNIANGNWGAARDLVGKIVDLIGHL